MHKIIYMEWVKIRPRARYEIGGSGVIPVSIDELPEARAAVDLTGFNLYGYRPLVEEIARRYEVSTSQVVTTQGTSMANYLAMAALLKAGDEVLVEHPAYEPLLDIPLMLGAKVTRFERRFQDGFRLDPEAVAARVSERTKLIVLTNPHNPSGRLDPVESVAEVGRIAARAGAHVMVDEVYLEFVFENRPRSAVHIAPNFLVTSSLTKAFGFDGLRCGWILAPSDPATAIWRLQDFFGVNGAIPAEISSTVAFQHLNRFSARSRRIIEANRPHVEALMAAHPDKLEWFAPDTGPVCFPRLRTGNADEFAARLRADYDVGVIPGRFFEMPGHFRLGFGGPADDLIEGLARVSEALKTTS